MVLLGFGLALRAFHHGPNRYMLSFPAMSRRDSGWIALGVLFVTYLCPVLTVYALGHLKVAVTVTLTSVAPVYSIPVVWFQKRERTGALAICGTALAVGGVCLLTLLGSDD